MSTAGFCGRCGEPRRAGDAFCRSCGSRFDDAGPGPTAPPQPPGVAVPPAYPGAPAPVGPPPPPSIAVPPPVAYPNPRTAAGTQPIPYQAQPGAPAPTDATTAAPSSKLRPLPLIGAIAVALASFLPWIAFPGLPGGTGFDVPFGFLFDQASLDPGGLDLGLITLSLGAGGAVLTFMRRSPGLRRLLGVAAAGIAILYLVQLNSLVGEAGGDISALDVLGFGVYVTIGGGAILAVTK